VPTSDKVTLETYQLKLELVLRKALKEAILNPNFAAIFVDDNTIRSKWPIVVRGKGAYWVVTNASASTTTALRPVLVHFSGAQDLLCSGICTHDRFALGQ
jgi:hypothetical protein